VLRRSLTTDVAGQTTIQPILDGAYLELRGRQSFTGKELDIPGLEIIHYDADAKTFRSEVYANMSDGPGGAPTPYEWAIEGDGTVIHRGAGATYRGRFSEDGTVLNGGWRPDPGKDSSDESAYDVTMTRID
jgi:hypothetical protein